MEEHTLAQTTIAVVNPKGGSSKTTTTMHLSAHLHGAGLRVLTVDADPQGSCLKWADRPDWPWAMSGMPMRNLHSQLAGLVPGRYDLVVIDTPALVTQSGIVASALRAADLVIVPTAPTWIEIVELAALREALDDVAPLRADGRPPAARVLLTRTIPNAASTADARQWLDEDGWTVLRTDVRRLEAFAQSGGDLIVVGAGWYAAAAAEVLDVLAELKAAA
jgi:chromosome partitioning protein